MDAIKLIKRAKHEATMEGSDQIILLLNSALSALNAQQPCGTCGAYGPDQIVPVYDIKDCPPRWVPCPTCRPCPACKPSGEAASNDECFYCHSTGYIPSKNDIPDQMCPYCEIGQAVIKGYAKAALGEEKDGK